MPKKLKFGILETVIGRISAITTLSVVTDLLKEDVQSGAKAHTAQDTTDIVLVCVMSEALTKTAIPQTLVHLHRSELF